MKMQSVWLVLGLVFIACVQASKAGAADAGILAASRNLGVKPEELHATAMPGILQVVQGTEVTYVSADGRYAIAGDLYDLQSKKDLTEDSRQQARRDLLAGIDESQMVIFGPEHAAHTITVFTDLDCTFCRKLHSEIAEYNRLGIRVRYLMFARGGPDSPSWLHAQQVWCSADRNQALTRAKRGETLDTPPCAVTPIAQNFELAKRMGVRGTPAIVLSNGEVRMGYLPPAELAEQLRVLAP